MNTNQQIIVTEQYTDDQRPSYEALRKWMDLPLTRIPYFIRDFLKKRNNIPVEVLQQWLEDSKVKVRRVAMATCQNRNNVPLDLIRQGLADSDLSVREAAMIACELRNDITPAVIQQWVDDSNHDVRKCALCLCHGRDDIPAEMLIRELTNENCPMIIGAALNACEGRSDIPAEAIKYAKERHPLVEINARRIELSRNTRLYLVEMERNHQTPEISCERHGVVQDEATCATSQLIRVVEPPERVYQKCVGDVIVVATIPDDAQIKVGRCGDYRASKAVIVEIIGQLCGEPTAISFRDNRLYYAGDEAIFDDFGHGTRGRFNGFHFYCTMQEAMAKPKGSKPRSV